MNRYAAADQARRISAVVPLPESLDELDADSRRRIEREAEAAGMTPTAYWRKVVEERKANIAAHSDAQTLARAVRDNRRGRY
jgi:hypothetical protein